MARFNGKNWTITANTKTVTFTAEDGEVMKMTVPMAKALVAKIRSMQG